MEDNKEKKIFYVNYQFIFTYPEKEIYNFYEFSFLEDELYSSDQKIFLENDLYFQNYKKKFTNDNNFEFVEESKIIFD